MWVAPNLITITGLAINMFAALLLIYHCPGAKEEVTKILINKSQTALNLDWVSELLTKTDNFFEFIINGTLI